MGGSDASVAAAVMYPQRICFSVMNLEIPTGKVTAVRRVKILAKRNSFQARMKQKTAVATSPGLIRGTIIRHITAKLVHPSNLALSSISLGISSIKDFSRRRRTRL